MAIVGRSGSGKTTLIRMLAGLLDPDSGKILFHGKKLEGPGEKLIPGHEEIRLVHQDFKLYHRMTVAENLLNALIRYTPDYKIDRTAELLDLCRLTHVKEHFVHEISGGEKQRVAIAMALATEPEVLLFDEPFSNLDLNTKEGLLVEIQSIARQTNTAVVLITHDSRDAMEIADEMLVLDKGANIRRDSPGAVYRQPNFHEVADLLGLYTPLTVKMIRQLLPGFEAASDKGTFGIWAEEVRLSGGLSENGVVERVIFNGSRERLLVRISQDLALWVYASVNAFQEGASVSVTIRQESLFPLKKAK